MRCGKVVEDTVPVGGQEKWQAMQEAAQSASAQGADVMYVGDSITDAYTLARLREKGGVGVSFNGNSYAVRAAEFAAISASARLLSPVIAAFAAQGIRGVQELGSMPGKLPAGTKEGKPLASTFTHIDYLHRREIERLSQQQRQRLRGKLRGSLG